MNRDSPKQRVIFLNLISPINNSIDTLLCKGLQVWTRIPLSLSESLLAIQLWLQLLLWFSAAIYSSAGCGIEALRVIPCFLMLLGLYSSVGISEQNLARKAIHLNKMSRLLPSESLCSPPQKFQLPLQLLCYVTVCSTFGAM